MVAEGALDPADLCYMFHLCNSSSRAQPPPPPSSLFSLLETSWLNRAPAQSLATPRKSGEQAVARSAAAEKRREGREGGGRGGRGGEVGKKKDDPIVFLQLSDIHLDQLFAEVQGPVCHSRGGGQIHSSSLKCNCLFSHTGVTFSVQPLFMLSQLVQRNGGSLFTYTLPNNVCLSQELCFLIF